jgi:hypothetical protein
VIPIKKYPLPALQFWLLIVLVAFIVLNLVLGHSIDKSLTAPKPGPKAEERKVVLEATLIEATACERCVDLSSTFEALRQASGGDVKEAKLASDSGEAKALIAKHGIRRLPALVVTGDTATLQAIDVFRASEGALIFDSTQPPYLDLATGAVKGLVAMTLLTKSGCDTCADLSTTVEQLKGSGMAFASEQTHEAASTEGKALIEKYGITKLPALLFSGDAIEYDFMKGVWDRAGSVEADGTLVFRNVFPPYYALNESKVRGLVDVTFLTDAGCAACYNVSLHRGILANSFGLGFGSERTLDVTSSDGKKLAAKYNITLAPTVLLMGDAGLYLSLEQAWPQVGTQEPDGTWIFRRVDLLQGVTYHDLVSGQVLNATPAEQ